MYSHVNPYADCIASLGILFLTQNYVTVPNHKIDFSDYADMWTAKLVPISIVQESKMTKEFKKIFKIQDPKVTHMGRRAGIGLMVDRGAAKEVRQTVTGHKCGFSDTEAKFYNMTSDPKAMMVLAGGEQKDVGNLTYPSFTIRGERGEAQARRVLVDLGQTVTYPFGIPRYVQSRTSAKPKTMRFSRDRAASIHFGLH